MSRPGRAFEILLLTEDGSPRAPATWEPLLKRLLHLVDPALDTSRVVMTAPDEGMRAGMRSNTWRNRTSDPKTLALVRAIATALRNGRFVFFHIDGDSTWEKRAASKSATDFHEQIRSKVQTTLGWAEPTPRRRGRTPAAPPPDDQVRRAQAAIDVERLMAMIPHYCLEAWLYQSLDAAVVECRRRHQEQHVSAWEAFRADRAQLDEIEKLPDTKCLGRTHNEVLAACLTNEVMLEVHARGKSLHAAVEQLRRSVPLIAALAATYTDPPTA